MKFLLLLIGFTLCKLLPAQQYPACIEKSSRNIYAAGNDTALSLYKAIPQTNDTRILLFHVRSTLNVKNVPVIAKAGANGKIEWTKTILPQDANYEIGEFDAIALNNKKVLVFYIAHSAGLVPTYVNGILWLNEDGTVFRHDSYVSQNDVFPATSANGKIGLKETAAGNIVFQVGLHTGVGGALIGNISSTGDMLWTKILQPSVGTYGVIDLVSFNNSIIIQGISNTITYPSCAVVNSTKLDLATGEIIYSTSSRDHSTVGAFNLSANSVSILTDDHKVKTIVKWASPYYYVNYLSFTHDTSGNLLQHTVHHTQNSGTSYLPSSAALNKKGKYVVKSFGGIDNTNNSYYISDVNDVLSQQRKVDNTSGFINFKTAASADIAFDNADSLYMYWNANRNGKNMVGYIKTPAYATGDFCSVKDSSFIQSDHYSMIKNWDFRLVPFAENVWAPSNFPLSYTSPTIVHEMICEKITGFCDPIKIDPVAAVCSIVNPVTIAVNKNPECRGRILFHFDTAAVKSWQQPNETTLLLFFDKSWKGKVYATASFCPTVKDSIELTIDAPLPGINLGNDTIVCTGDVLRLSVGGNFTKYTWQDASAHSSFNTTKAGKYYVTVEDHCLRSYSDTIIISLVDKKVSLGADISICKKETVQLSANGKVVSYSWSPAYNVSSTTLPTISIHPERTTLYSVTGLTAEGCTVKDSILVTVKDCPPDFFMPTGFTPNSDGKNDLLKPIVMAPLEQYQFSIYNRWGQRIFYTTDIAKGWDGKAGGVVQDTGAFIWMCTYKFYDKPVENGKGTFMLIR